MHINYTGRGHTSYRHGPEAASTNAEDANNSSEGMFPFLSEKCSLLPSVHIINHFLFCFALLLENTPLARCTAVVYLLQSRN